MDLDLGIYWSGLEIEPWHFPKAQNTRRERGDEMTNHGDQVLQLAQLSPAQRKHRELWRGDLSRADNFVITSLQRFTAYLYVLVSFLSRLALLSWRG